MTRLGRTVWGSGPPIPVRMVHLGPGAFFRAHPAWYTGHAGGDWGIAAVTARSDHAVRSLGGQDGLYALVVRGVEGDRAEVVSSISDVVAHADPRRTALIAGPTVSVITLTVTEAAYGPDSPLLARLVGDLDARRRNDGGPIALVSCDNVAGNGAALRRHVLEQAERRDTIPGGSGLAEWIETSCAFPATVVDRITPASQPEDLATASLLIGFDDQAAVVTEPWSEWIIEDAFAGAARPPWETSGARLVGDVEPWELRKLRLLNAGHSLLAYLGGLRGHRFVHEAVADPLVHEALLDLWAEARRELGGVTAGLLAYCGAVEGRWANHRLPHDLAQIAASGVLKLRQRIVPTIMAARAEAEEPLACARLIGTWLAYERGCGPVPPDTDAPVAEAAAGDLRAAAHRVLGLLDDRLADDGWLVDAVAEAARGWDEGGDRGHRTSLRG